MKVLGISPLDKDSTASFVEDGDVLFSVGEERYSRTKQQDGFPYQAIQAGLAHTGWGAEDIDLVAYPFLTPENEEKQFDRNFSEEAEFNERFNPRDLGELLNVASARVPRRAEKIEGLEDPNERFDKSLGHRAFYSLAGFNRYFSGRAARSGSLGWRNTAAAAHLQWCRALETGLESIGYTGKLRRLDHHTSHAANAFYASGFERALCITLDGYGTGLAGSASIAENGKIKRVHGITYPNSLGTLYEHVTSSLGFKPGRHEGKIVGLAAYGDPQVLSEVLLSRIEQTEGDFKVYQPNNIYFARYLATRYPKVDVAAAYQHVLEVVAAQYVRYWAEKLGCDHVVLSGGVTANVKLNQRIFEIPEVRKIFVYPNMGDGGCGTGAALYFSWQGGAREPLRDAYFGQEYTDAEIETELQKSGLAYEKPEEYAQAVAKLIHAGNVVARFDGRMEYGPRALGNRSILYHAREPEVNQWLNKRLGRTEFMPFAPVTLFEAAARCYKNIDGAEHSAQFMTVTFDCTEEMIRSCPAAVHVDGTARPQLIKREFNARYYDILKEYEKLSGIPSLINTSFNMHEEPIVCSPKDAVRAFLDGKIDYLAAGSFIVKHPSL